MDPHDLAQRVVATMFDRDPFSRWLGIERLAVAPGRCVLSMAVRDEMLNGFAIAHGGIAYSLADSALAFASNSHGVRSVSIETSITHMRPVHSGDTLTATTTEKNRSTRFATYEVIVTDQLARTVALFKGTVFRTGEEWVV
ncbi:MAG TPA: hotdog fold thioesterase [Flavobacteriales bacterium]|nr:hotdog fold thioesterase [Flavobacteriales bacterium]HMR26557.1 hotdog fold thioesterase [Flavobacteriales bacterium]